MCVLMLRGPQTIGEIRDRTGKLAEFASLTEVEPVLEELIERHLAVHLPRRPGQKEARYAHLLSGSAAAAEANTAGEGDTPGVVSTESARAGDSARVAAPEIAVEDLRQELKALQARFDEFTRQFG